MPDRFSIDDLVDKLILLQKIENGLEQSENREVYSNEEAKKMIIDILTVHNSTRPLTDDSIFG